MKNMEMTVDTRILYPSIKTFTEGRRLVSLRHAVDDKKNYFLFKRIFDFSISLFLTIFVLSWLCPIIALIIIIDSRGPVFFSQRRVGKGGRIFTCYKFRTMVINFDADHKQAIENDTRITRVGKFLRDSNLDELPQLINVIAGDMSIVGPRPHMLTDCATFSSYITGYKARNFVKPGITGLAQVKGYHGPTSDYQSMLTRFEEDVKYIYTAGIWLDIKILSKTVFLHIINIFRKN